MNQLTISHYQPATFCGAAQPIAGLYAPRELSEEEMNMVSGGLPFVIAPLIIKAAEIAAVAFIGGFAGHSGYMAAQHIWGEEEQACR